MRRTMEKARQSFIRVSPKQMFKYLKYWEKHISTAGFFLTIKTESCQTTVTDAAVFQSSCGNWKDQKNQQKGKYI